MSGELFTNGSNTVLLGKRLQELFELFGSMIQPKRRLLKIIFRSLITLVQVSITNFVTEKYISDEVRGYLGTVIQCVVGLLSALRRLRDTCRSL